MERCEKEIKDCVYVHVCTRSRERERERGGGRERISTELTNLIVRLLLQQTLSDVTHCSIKWSC